MTTFDVVLKKREVYGVHRYYPVNELSKVICELMEKKTLNQNHLELLKKNNWNVEFSKD